MVDKHLYLKHYFGYSQFRDGQEDAVNNILRGSENKRITDYRLNEQSAYGIIA